MATYYLFGKYSQEGIKQISAERSQRFKDLIKKLGGKVKSMDALLGEKDLVFVVELPGVKEAAKVSLTMTKTMGISFTTAEAITIEEFDKLAKEI